MSDEVEAVKAALLAAFEAQEPLDMNWVFYPLGPDVPSSVQLDGSFELDALAAAAIAAVDQARGWRPIESAPNYERVLVAGWQPAHGRTRGYWWWHESDIIDGCAPDYPKATIWHPIIMSPLPAPPKEGA